MKVSWWKFHHEIAFCRNSFWLCLKLFGSKSILIGEYSADSRLEFDSLSKLPVERAVAMQFFVCLKWPVRWLLQLFENETRREIRIFRDKRLDFKLENQMCLKFRFIQLASKVEAQKFEVQTLKKLKIVWKSLTDSTFTANLFWLFNFKGKEKRLSLAGKHSSQNKCINQSSEKFSEIGESEFNLLKWFPSHPSNNLERPSSVI